MTAKISSMQKALNDLFFPIVPTPKDSFTIQYVAGYLFATLNTRAGMHVELVRSIDAHASTFDHGQVVDPRSVDKVERNRIIVELDEGGIPQEKIALFFSLGQSTIAMIVKQHRDKITKA